MRLKGKRAIVTGAASGIGAATARVFAREGARVLLVDRDADNGQKVTDEIGNAGGVASFLCADMGVAAAMEEMIATAIERFGGLDILHNNTAGARVAPLAELSMDDWERSIRLGLTPYYYASRCAMPHLIASGSGAIVNTASISGLFADIGLGAYNTVKSAIINLTRSLALDNAKHNVRCNAVCPGIIFTPPFELVKARYPQLIERMAASVPMRRFGRAEEIANVVLFLASDEASFVTGATYVADGGRTAWTGTPSFGDDLRGGT